MQPSLREIESAIEEAEHVRSRHDGVHVIHSCVTVLQLCLSSAQDGKWSDITETSYRETVCNIRCIDRTGFPSHRK